MKHELYTALNTICPNNVYLQGTFDANAAYPDTFITYWTNYTEDHAHFDDVVVSIDWNFSVMVYSTDPTTLATMAATIRTTLIPLGFIPQGRGSDLQCDKPTHSGWAMEFIKTEKLN